MRSIIKQTDGFTLLEAMVATVISSLIMIMIYTAQKGITQSVKSATKTSNYYESINLAITRLDRDLSCAILNPQNNRMYFYGENQAFPPKKGELHFITINRTSLMMTSNLDTPAPRSDIEEVYYYIDQDKENSEIYNLYRAEKIYYDGEFETKGDPQLLLKNVSDIEFEFTARRQYENKWDSRDVKRMPRSVRTTLKVKNPMNNQIDSFTIISNVKMQK